MAGIGGGEAGLMSAPDDVEDDEQLLLPPDSPPADWGRGRADAGDDDFDHRSPLDRRLASDLADDLGLETIELNSRAAWMRAAADGTGDDDSQAFAARQAPDAQPSDDMSDNMSFGQPLSGPSSGTAGDTTCFLYVVCLFSTIGGLTFGYDIGVVGGFLPQDSFRDTFDFPRHREGQDDPSSVSLQLGLIVALVSLGSFFGASLSGMVVDRLGRRWSMCLGTAVATAGALMQTFAQTKAELMLGRFVAGLGIGELSSVVPMFCGEVAPSRLRGALVTVFQLSITMGILIAYAVNLGTEKVSSGWRISLGIQAVFSAVLALGAPFLPESPRWLVQRGQTGQAARVLRRLRGPAWDVTGEVEQVRLAVAQEAALGKAEWRDLLLPANRKQMILGCGIMLSSQLSSVNTAIFYAPLIFSQLGVSALASTAGIGLVNFFSTFLGMRLIDSTGRKPLLFYGALLMMLAMLGAAVSAFAGFGWGVVGCLALFIFGFASTWGCAGWVSVAELFAQRVRGKAMGVSSSSNWIANFVLTLLTPLMLNGNALGVGGTFALSAAFLLFISAFVLFTLPEVKGKSLEDVQAIFRGGQARFLDISDWRAYVTCPSSSLRARSARYDAMD